MKILHLSCVRELSSGQRKQLAWEAASADRLQGAQWKVLALSNAAPRHDFERQIPWAFRGLFLRNLYAWITMLRLQKDFDVILCRHMTFDPFALLLARWVKRRVSIHHAKETEELRLIRPGLRGRLASWLESFSGRAAIDHALGVVGVTNEIRDYQAARSTRGKPAFSYPNGILLEDAPALVDGRHPDEIHAAFICGKFSSWHGLEKLIQSALHAPDPAVLSRLRIHLIGNTLPEQEQAIRSDPLLSGIFKLHGSLPFERYQPLLEECDIGLASFALDEKGLQEAATLKVREYLALGLPVYSGHADTALPDNFDFYRVGLPDLRTIIDFAEGLKHTSRDQVRSASAPFIEKSMQMQGLLTWLATLERHPPEELTAGARGFS